MWWWMLYYYQSYCFKLYGFITSSCQNNPRFAFLLSSFSCRCHQISFSFSAPWHAPFSLSLHLLLLSLFPPYFLATFFFSFFCLRLSSPLPIPLLSALVLSVSSLQSSPVLSFTPSRYSFQLGSLFYARRQGEIALWIFPRATWLAGGAGVQVAFLRKKKYIKSEWFIILLFLCFHSLAKIALQASETCPLRGIHDPWPEDGECADT